MNEVQVQRQVKNLRNAKHAENGEKFTFMFLDVPVRAVVLDNAPWFVGKDVANALGYKNTRKAVIDHTKGVPKVTPFDTDGGTQTLRVINFSDLFRLTANCNLEEGDRFERWIFETVLPEIYNTGGYVPEGMTLANEAVLESTIQDMVAYSHLRAEVDAFKKALVPEIKDDREALEEIARRYWAAGAALSQLQIDLEQMKQDIAEIKGDQSLVRYLIDKNEKLQLRGTRLSENERRDIWFKYRIGMKVAQIERETGRDASSILRIIKREYRGQL
jgi:prophage antirepressor-like protein